MIRNGIIPKKYDANRCKGITMPIQIQKNSLSPLAEQGRTIYKEQLKAILEPGHNGEVVAIHVDSGDYVIGNNHRDAAHTLAERHEADGRIVTLTIGLPTDADLRLATRFASRIPVIKCR